MDWIQSQSLRLTWVIFTTLLPNSFIHLLARLVVGTWMLHNNNHNGAALDQNLDISKRLSVRVEERRQRITQHFRSFTIRKFFPLMLFHYHFPRFLFSFQSSSFLHSIWFFHSWLHVLHRRIHITQTRNIFLKIFVGKNHFWNCFSYFLPRLSLIKFSYRFLVHTQKIYTSTQLTTNGRGKQDNKIMNGENTNTTSPSNLQHSTVFQSLEELYTYLFATVLSIYEQSTKWSKKDVALWFWMNGYSPDIHPEKLI